MNGCKGNHDDAGGYSATFPKYFPYPYPNLAPTGKNDPNGNPYYSNLYWSFDYGPVHFAIVDEYSDLAQGSVQYKWLVSDLKSTTKPWKILIYHEGAYSAGSDADNIGVRVFEPLVTQYGVDLLYSGHSHNYARAGAYNLAQAGGDQIALNVPHITSGGGGAPLYMPDWSNNPHHEFPHVITAWPAFEFMSFDIEGKTLTMTAYEVNGVSTFHLPSRSLSYTMIEQIVLNHFKDVSSQINATVSGPAYNQTSGTYNGSLTIRNKGSALTGNIDVVLDGILYLQGVGKPGNQCEAPQDSIIAQNPATGKGSPRGSGLVTTVTLTNATGSSNGEPMIRVSTSGLATGASVSVPLVFANPTDVPIKFTPITYQE
jgi:hypothetical protein